MDLSPRYNSVSTSWSNIYIQYTNCVWIKYVKKLGEIWIFVLYYVKINESFKNWNYWLKKQYTGMS